MASGNFLVGDGLSIKGFQAYVTPLLREKGLAVADMLYVTCRASAPYGRDSGRSNATILASVSGEGDLETILNDALVHAGENLEIEEKKRLESHSGDEALASRYQVLQKSWARQDAELREVKRGIYETLGVYRGADAATQLFPLMAQKYLAAETRQEIDALTEQIRAVGEKLAKMGGR